MSLVELGDFLVSIGVYQGMNFDGGGSTSLVINGKLVNRPSDQTGERAVGNAILVRASTLGTGPHEHPVGLLSSQSARDLVCGARGRLRTRESRSLAVTRDSNLGVGARDD